MRNHIYSLTHPQNKKTCGKSASFHQLVFLQKISTKWLANLQKSNISQNAKVGVRAVCVLFIGLHCLPLFPLHFHWTYRSELQPIYAGFYGSSISISCVFLRIFNVKNSNEKNVFRFVVDFKPFHSLSLTLFHIDLQKLLQKLFFKNWRCSFYPNIYYPYCNLFVLCKCSAKGFAEYNHWQPNVK